MMNSPTPTNRDMMIAYCDVRTAVRICRQAKGPAPPNQGSLGTRNFRLPWDAGKAIPPPCLDRCNCS